MVFLPSGGKEWLVFSETGEDQVHLIINLHTPSDLSSSHPPGSNMCISLRRRGIIGPVFHPGLPRLAYAEIQSWFMSLSRLVPSELDGLRNVTHD